MAQLLVDNGGGTAIDVSHTIAADLRKVIEQAQMRHARRNINGDTVAIWHLLGYTIAGGKGGHSTSKRARESQRLKIEVIGRWLCVLLL